LRNVELVTPVIGVRLAIGQPGSTPQWCQDAAGAAAAPSVPSAMPTSAAAP